MSVDGSIFAKKAGKWIDVDRTTNMSLYWNVDGHIHHSVLEDIRDNLMNKEVSADDLKYLAETNIECDDDSDRDKAYWSRKILAFIKLYPNDEYFMRDDHGCPDNACYQKEALKYGDTFVSRVLGTESNRYVEEDLKGFCSIHYNKLSSHPPLTSVESEQQKKDTQALSDALCVNQPYDGKGDNQ